MDIDKIVEEHSLLLEADGTWRFFPDPRRIPGWSVPVSPQHFAPVKAFLRRKYLRSKVAKAYLLLASIAIIVWRCLFESSWSEMLPVAPIVLFGPLALWLLPIVRERRNLLRQLQLDPAAQNDTWEYDTAAHRRAALKALKAQPIGKLVVIVAFCLIAPIFMFATGAGEAGMFIPLLGFGTLLLLRLRG